MGLRGDRFGFANYFRQPTMTGHACSGPQERRSGQSGSGEKSTILVIDDEQAVLTVFNAALSPYFEVVTASSVREAEFILHKKTFKVVIADHLMPGGNGMSFLVRVREEFPQMQRILVTGYMKPEMLLRSVNEAALFRYLLKPVTMAGSSKSCRMRPSCTTSWWPVPERHACCHARATTRGADH